jgi:hypothetical protein
MGIYNFICGPRSYDAFPKWPARSFGLATSDLKNGRSTGNGAYVRKRLLRGRWWPLGANLVSDQMATPVPEIMNVSLYVYDGDYNVRETWQKFGHICVIRGIDARSVVAIEPSVWLAVTNTPLCGHPATWHTVIIQAQGYPQSVTSCSYIMLLQRSVLESNIRMWWYEDTHITCITNWF